MPDSPNGIFAADPGALRKGEEHLLAIMAMAVSIERSLPPAYIHAEGDGPIAKAIRTKYQPAAANNKDFVESLRKLLAFNGDQVRSLRQVVTDDDIASGDIARNLGGRR
jgi:transcription initiation factor TFIID subunit TAF12